MKGNKVIKNIFENSNSIKENQDKYEDENNLNNFFYSNNRIKHPLKRIGPKNSTQFKRISWNEAYNIICEKFIHLKSAYGPDVLAFYSHYGQWFSPVLSRFATELGTPNFLNEVGNIDLGFNIPCKLTFGSEIKADIKNTKLMFMWNSCSFISFKEKDLFYSNLLRGIPLIVVDSKITPITKKANLHLRIKPGTEGILALGLAKVLIEDRLYNKDFIDTYVYGFQEFKDYLDTISFDEIKNITGINYSLIKKAANLYSNISPASMITLSSNILHNVNGVQNIRAILSLIALTGNFDVFGGNIAKVQSYRSNKNLLDTNFCNIINRSKLKSEGIGEREFPVWSIINDSSQTTLFPKYVLENTPYNIKSLFAIEPNHKTWNNCSNLIDALKNLDFFVTVDTYLNDINKYADIILPKTVGLERENLILSSNLLKFQKQVVPPLEESKHELEIILDLARYMKIEDEILNMNFTGIINYILEPLNLGYEDIKENKTIYPRSHTYKEKKYLKEKLNTRTGKVELFSTTIDALDLDGRCDPLPTYNTFEDIYSSFMKDRNYQFTLNIQRESPSIIRRIPIREVETVNSKIYPNLKLNPIDALELDVHNKQLVRLKTPAGSMVCSIEICPESLKDVLTLYSKNNNLDYSPLVHKDWVDPISGFFIYDAIPATIEKIKK